MSAKPPVVVLCGDRVAGFVEKPRSDHWINGGFFCFESEALDHIGPDSVLEREPLEGLAAAGLLRAHRHEGFWDCMDTYKDAVVLDDLWRAGAAPWRVWNVDGPKSADIERFSAHQRRGDAGVARG